MEQVDFRAIRPIRGSANNGFEELCCQLAGAEPTPAGSRFVRNGTPDGGVEAYWIRPDGSEHGWQAKYFFDIGYSQWRQLDESVHATLETHPGLSTYTVCLPIDLPDARLKGRKSLQAKWEERAESWAKAAAARGMTVAFELWGEHQLMTRLAEERHSGRHWFFFRRVELSPTWFREHVAETLEAAGPRYTSVLNVNLPIAMRFEALGYDRSFQARLSTSRGKCRERFAAILTRLGGPDFGREPTVASVIRSGEALLRCLDEFGNCPPTYSLVDSLSRSLRESLTSARAMAEHLQSREPEDRVAGVPDGGSIPTVARRSEHDSHALGEYRSALDDLEGLFSEGSAELAGRPALLLVGQAGNRKTHLLCDVARRRVEDGLPTVVMLGEQLGRGEVWGQIIRRLGLGCTRDEFLGALQSSAEAAGGRALLLVDAINEAREIEWRSELPSLLEVVRRYPRVGIAASCRSTYERLLVRSDLLPGRMSRVEHDGFAPVMFQAVGAFCRHYRIESLNTPPLDPEFENPLFLKLFCKGLSDRGLSRPPRGHRGLRRIFSFLIDAVESKLGHPSELDYPEGDRVVHRAIEAVADAMIGARRDAIPRAEAQAVLGGILPRAGTDYSKSLLGRLVAEGILADDVYLATEDDETPVPIVRFGYERLADFQIAQRLLDRHLDLDDPAAAFRDDAPLGRLFAKDGRARRLQGMHAALIVLLPERTGREIAELMPGLVASGAYRQSFLEALPWREGEHITPRAISYLCELLERGDHGSATYSESDAVLDRVIQVAAQPGHPLNARWLHARLLSLPMPERDLVWSTFLHRSRKDRPWKKSGAVERLIDWAWSEDDDDGDPCLGFEDEVVTLAGIALVWCFTTANRFTRDRATKALVSAFRGRLHLLPGLLNEFAMVDDPYVVERLYGAVYGCVMRSGDADLVGRVARAVHAHVFANGNPPVHILLRDYARGIVEYALSLGCRLDLDPSTIRPPYRSEPPPEDAPRWDELHDAYKADGYGGLILSLWPDHGDFARYVMGSDSIDSGLHTWTDRPDPYQDVRRLNAERIRLPEELARRHYKRGLIAGLYDGALEALSRVYGGEVEEDIEGTGQTRVDDYDVDEMAMQWAAEREEFLLSLSPEERDLISRHDEAEARWREASEAARQVEQGYHGRGDLPCRWIFTRVLELGWVPERFARFDGELNRDDYRDGHKAERIGKKYQWIAYHELAARVFDHRPMHHSPHDEGKRYEGPWQEGFRDIDPSFLAGADRPDADDRQTWWMPLGKPLSGRRGLEDREWLTQLDSIPDFSPVLSPQRPPDSTGWIALKSYTAWHETDDQRARRGGRYDRRLTCSIDAFLLRPADVAGLVKAASERQWSGMDVRAIDWHTEFLGEFRWAPSFRDYEEGALAGLDEPLNGHETQRDRFEGAEAILAPTVMRYSREGSGFDCSLPQAVSGYTPSTWLARRMGLLWGRRRFAFTDRGGRVVGFDPSHEQPGPGGFLIAEDELRSFLARNGLDLDWLLIGEKMLTGGMDFGPGDRDEPRVTVFRQAFRLGPGGVELLSRTAGYLGQTPVPH